jgi:hypothetical protein
VKLGLATVAAFVALVATAPAQASTPQPWCGGPSAATDRLPDATQAFAVHVAYVRPPGEPDHFTEWAPRIVGDVAAIDAWWRGEDAARTLRFDLFPAPGCATAFGALDITSVELPQEVGGISSAFQTLRLLLASEIGFREPEKAYLVYFDGSTDQIGDERVCGQGVAGRSGLPGLAVIYLDSCGAANGEALRPVVAVHELTHVLGAVGREAPNACDDGHVCDVENDLMTATLAGEELETLVLDGGRDDYYAHAGSWTDVQDSFFLERLDSPDRAAPSVPRSLRAGTDFRSGLVRFSWAAAADDVGPVAYRLYQDSRFLQQVTARSVLLSTDGRITQYSVRAVDGVGRLSAVASVRFLDGVGMVDAQGRLVRDTVPPPAVARTSVRRTAKTVVLSWRTVRDAGGLRGYRVKIGSRTLTLRRPRLEIARSRLRPVSVAAVDRAGNVGPAVVVPLSRLR